QRGLVLAVGHIERFNPVVVELRRRLREGMAGRIYQISAERLSPYPSRIADSGVVIDLASHDIDLLRYLTGEPARHYFGETAQSINSDREDLFNGLIRFESGIIGVLNVNWMTPQKVRRLTITASRGYFTCDLLSQQLFFYENETAPSQWDQLSVLHGVTEGNVLGIRIPRREPLAAELSDFVESVQRGRAPTVSGREGVETLRLALGLLGSASEMKVLPTVEAARG
ncbi:MAG TPA: Gfo/Idh/MocA family oxidoreductase, partial [Polyangiaceae bacterium]|nr:Gfo/Idh/MocA family oxidoreductase [Polyangiaceae bacterium]